MCGPPFIRHAMRARMGAGNISQQSQVYSRANGDAPRIAMHACDQPIDQRSTSQRGSSTSHGRSNVRSTFGKLGPDFFWDLTKSSPVFSLVLAVCACDRRCGGALPNRPGIYLANPRGIPATRCAHHARGSIRRSDAGVPAGARSTSRSLELDHSGGFSRQSSALLALPAQPRWLPSRSRPRRRAPRCRGSVGV